MFSKISVTAIVKDHLSTLKNNRTGKPHYPDIFLFIIFPAVIAGILVRGEVQLNDGLVNALITSLSIFSALLFNLLLLVYDISGKEASSRNTSNDPVERKKAVRKHALLREIYINVSFSILISTIAVVVLLGYFLKIDTPATLTNVKLFQIFPAVVYYLSIQFIFTLFMVLKRVYRLLAHSFEE